MRTVLIGAVGSTEIVLRAMQDAGYPPVLLVTFEPEIGRRRHADYVELAPLAGPETAVLFVNIVNDREVLERIRAAEPDALFVVGWSQLIGPELRAVAHRWCVGFHPTPLPALRGRGAMGWTIALGLPEAGASLFVMDDGIDTGDILAQQRFAVDARETLPSLGDKLMGALDEMIRELLPRLADGTAHPQPQAEAGASYCARRTAADQLIDWTRPAIEIDRLIRASGRPYAGAFTFTRKRRVTIWSAEPFEMPDPYHAFDGQVVVQHGECPVVRCGDGGFLMITDYGTDEGEPLKGQVRFRNKMGEIWE
jgi:methionyl-tRNA formyltransferase